MPECPNCKTHLAIHAVLDGDDRMSFEVTPQAGQMLTARGLGGMIENMAKLLFAVGKDLRITTEVYIENVTCNPETKAVRVDFAITRARYKADLEKLEKEAAPKQLETV